jgi:putative ABC transport system ATP-binding protein
MTGEHYILRAGGLSKSFGRGEARVRALRDASLDVAAGEFVAVTGPSGSGKSTLLHVLGLMTPADDGWLEIDGQRVGPGQADRTALRRTKIGFVFQRFNLLATLSAAENVAISLRVRGIKPDGRIGELLRRVGVAHLAGRKPGRISVGEQQRVALVRAIAHRPAILFADEPTGSLDSAASDALLTLLREMNRDSRQTVVMITHSPAAAAYAGRVLHMVDGELSR